MTSAIAFVNANVFDGNGPCKPGQTVVVQDGLIAGIGQGEVPSHAERIDLDGRTLMPGMTVGHWHGEYENIGPPLFSMGRGGVDVGEVDPPIVAGLLSAQALQTALMSGVTRVVSGACGNDSDWQLKVAMERGVFVGARITPCSRHVITTGDYEDRCHWWKTDMMKDGIRRTAANAIADGPEQIAKAVRQEILRGAEIIKLLPTGGHGIGSVPGYRGMSRAELEVAVNTAHERGARVRAHVATAEGILECVEVGVDIIDHGDFLNDACIEAMIKAGSIYVPSILFAKLVSYGGVGDPTPGREADEAWDNLREMLKRANEAGVIMVPGDDYGAQGMQHVPGVYARELQVYVDDMGIPPADVLRWATFNGAKLGLDSGTGSVAKGKIADLVVTNRNPVDDIGILTRPEDHLDMVMLGGRFVKKTFAAPGRSMLAEPGGREFTTLAPTLIAAE